MSLTRAVENLRETRGADPTQPWGNSVPPRNGELGLTAAGVTMNDELAMSLSTVASCIALLADGISTLPLRALKDSKDHSKKLIDPQPAVILNPWPEGTIQDWLTQVMVSLLLRGNFYGRVVARSPMTGYPTAVMPIHPDQVTATRSRETGERVYKVAGVHVPTDDMIHIRSALLAPGAFVAMNPVEYARMSWGLAAAAEKYGGQFFANSASPSGVITVDGDLDEEEVREMGFGWKMGHQGIGMAQMPAILTGGAKWQQVSIAPDDAQFLQTRTFQREQIISWFHVPPHKVGIMDKTPGPTSAEDMEMLYVSDALVPWATRIETVMSALLPRGQIAKFDFSSRLRGNSLQRAQVAQIHLQTGVTVPDEERAIEDLPPLPFELGQVITRPMNATAYSTVDGEPCAMPVDPTLKPPNPGGSQGGGDPNNDPGITKPDSLSAPDLEDRSARETHVSMTAPPVHVSAPDVHVDAPDIRVDAPNVTVEPSFTVEAAKAPDVHVNVPAQRRTRKIVNRDERGLIMSVDEVWVDDDVPVS